MSEHKATYGEPKPVPPSEWPPCDGCGQPAPQTILVPGPGERKGSWCNDCLKIEAAESMAAACSAIGINVAVACDDPGKCDRGHRLVYLHTDADASAQPSADVCNQGLDLTYLPQLLEALRDDHTMPFDGLQGVDAVIGQLRELEDHDGNAKEFCALDPTAWYELMEGAVTFLEDVRVALKLMRGEKPKLQSPAGDERGA